MPGAPVLPSRMRALWWLLPLLAGLIGGIIAAVVAHRRGLQWRRFVVVGVVASIVMFMANGMIMSNLPTKGAPSAYAEILVADAELSGWVGDDVEAAASMVAGDTRVDCDTLKDSYAMVKTKVDSVFRGVDTLGIRAGLWAQGVTALYDDECYRVSLPALASGDRNVPYRINDEIRVRLMVLDAYPLDCEILRNAAETAEISVLSARLVGAGPGYAQDKRVYDYYTSMKANGDCW